LKKSKDKEGALMYKTEAKSSHPLGLSNWQTKEFQKLSAQELRNKGMAWIPKGSIRIQDTCDDQAKGVTQLKEKKRYERRSSKLRFAPNQQNYWSLTSPFAV
jgi:hypothetical protein